MPSRPPNTPRHLIPPGATHQTAPTAATTDPSAPLTSSPSSSSSDINIDDADLSADASDPPSQPPDAPSEFDPAAYNLHSILPLSTLTTSSHKPHCGPLALLHPSTSLFWQSDGPKPHTLNVHFFKLVEIRLVRVFLDFDLDESYTPTRMQFWAGTGPHDLEMVGEEKWSEPRGWQRVDLKGVGGKFGGFFSRRARRRKRVGVRAPEVENEDEVDWADESDEDEGDEGPEGQTENILKGQGVLRCFLLQIRVLENHQNGKDTHIRGLQIFAKDKVAARRKAASAQILQTPRARSSGARMSTGPQVPGRMSTGFGGPAKKERRQEPFELLEPEWARDFELR